MSCDRRLGLQLACAFFRREKEEFIRTTIFLPQMKCAFALNDEYVYLKKVARTNSSSGKRAFHPCQPKGCCDVPGCFIDFGWTNGSYKEFVEMPYSVQHELLCFFILYRSLPILISC